jgi:plasmid maintenance system antidote protein VapI
MAEKTAVEFITEQEQVIKVEIAEIEEKKKKLTATLALKQLAKTFDVSQTAMALRLAQLKIFNNQS